MRRNSDGDYVMEQQRTEDVPDPLAEDATAPRIRSMFSLTMAEMLCPGLAAIIENPILRAHIPRRRLAIMRI
ncbi:hypothetical protein MTO96_030394 [Rhipicephalus appendiculatus]